LQTVSAEWTVQEEDRTDGDEADHVGRVPGDEPQAFQPEPISSPLRNACERRLNLETNAACTSLEVD
jgi:hypothetical protein